MVQRDIWTKEYEEQGDLPSSRTNKPSRAVVEFSETPQFHNVKTAFDAGCGRGRNTIFLAQRGIHVTGIDFVQSAIEQANEAAIEAGVNDKTAFVCQSMAEPFPLADASVDLVVDMMSMHTLRAEERHAYIAEVLRILRPGGFFVFYTIAADSPAAMELFKTSPGGEDHSYLIPQTGAFEKATTREDLESLFPGFTFLRFDRVTEFTPAYGDVYERVYYSGVLQKP